MKISLSKPELDKKDISIIVNSLKSGWLTHGPENLKFENFFKKKIGTKYAISMNSCTSALECSLKVLEKKGEGNRSRENRGRLHGCDFIRRRERDRRVHGRVRE